MIPGSDPTLLYSILGGVACDCSLALALLLLYFIRIFEYNDLLMTALYTTRFDRFFVVLCHGGRVAVHGDDVVIVESVDAHGRVKIRAMKSRDSRRSRYMHTTHTLYSLIDPKYTVTYRAFQAARRGSGPGRRFT